MNSVPELIRAVESAGGRFMVDGGRLGIVPATAAEPVMEELRQHKAELLAELARRPANIPHPAGWLVNGQRVTVFPHCPRCASYALYRKNNIGAYECLTCGLSGIEESIARRLV
jgi:predicted RNA-binding Zn-ribbon protein involved in translation (DUF1610 family)